MSREEAEKQQNLLQRLEMEIVVCFNIKNVITTFIAYVVQFTSSTLALLKTKRTIGIYSDNRCYRHDVSTAAMLFYLTEMDTALGDPQYAIYGMLSDSTFVSNYSYV